MPGQHNSAGYVPVLTGVANLQDAVDNSRFQIRLPSGILVMPAADALEHWQPPPGTSWRHHGDDWSTISV